MCWEISICGNISNGKYYISTYDGETFSSVVCATAFIAFLLCSALLECDLAIRGMSVCLSILVSVCP